METLCTGSDTLRFARLWIADPLRVAAVVPSGEVLARLITSELGPDDGPVLELGPGTGVFTRALIERGVAEDHLLLVERSAEFAELLRQRFPRAQLLHGDAARLRPGEWAATGLGGAVSGLPLLSMKPTQVLRILAAAFRHLRPGAGFYQFTYGPRCPVPRVVLERLQLSAQRIGGTWRNLPPASVYRIERLGSIGTSGYPGSYSEREDFYV
ncbi:MAG: class I SAM-dependent methyltransferase [Lysobacter sp.]